jgi:hypothetical protein
MEPKFQSSFIPKGPLATSGTFTNTQPKQKGIFGLLASFIFGVSVVLTIAVFAYNFYLGYSIKKMGAELEAARAELDQDSITEITRLNSRIVSTQGLISKHVVMSPLFKFLENSTLKNVRFSDFDFSTDKNALILTMKGEARGYSAVALQADIFNKSKFIKDPIFSDLRLDDAGNVTFIVKMSIDPSLVSYKKLIDDIGAPVLINLPSATTTASSTNNISTTTNTQATTTVKTKTQASSTPQ